jgi:hypothetical protein
MASNMRQMMMPLMARSQSQGAGLGVTCRAANSQGFHRTPWHPLADPLDPLRIGKAQQEKETLPHQCQDLWLDCETHSCSLSCPQVTWGLFLEKAFAKLHGVRGGHTHRTE